MPNFKHIFFVIFCYLILLNLVLFNFIILHCVCQEYVYIFQTIVFQKSQENPS